MKKRGRPNQNGQQPMWMLERATLAVRGYDEARKAGEKHDAAIKEAVRFIKAEHPRMPASETEVKRILAGFRSSRRPVGLLVSKPESAFCMVPSRDGRVVEVKVLWMAAVGPRPVYPRKNAVAKPPK